MPSRASRLVGGEAPETVISVPAANGQIADVASLGTLGSGQICSLDTARFIQRMRT